MHSEQNVSTGAKLMYLGKIPFNEGAGQQLVCIRIVGNSCGFIDISQCP